MYNKFIQLINLDIRNINSSPLNNNYNCIFNLNFNANYASIYIFIRRIYCKMSFNLLYKRDEIEILIIFY